MQDHCYVEPISQSTPTDEPNEARIIKLIVSGMRCMNCAMRVRNGLLCLAGVVSADVDWQSGLTLVDYIPAQITPDDLIHAVVQAGDDDRYQYSAHIFK